MVIDTNRCVGCDACTLACKVQNGTPPGVLLARVLEKEEGRYPNVKRTYLPVLCFHCQDPACVKACPSKALSKRSDGIVVVDKDRCCGVKACMAACPYDALHFYEDPRGYFGEDLTPIERYFYSRHRPGTVLKCDFCTDRVEMGMQPACVEACPVSCRYFGDLDNPKSQVSQLVKMEAEQVLPEAGTNPSVLYLFKSGGSG
ncbi:MAG: 4Fe-4S dicluster domain-containing protein [Deltaproteobacteria bacterium]|nr:4Fe-4S dicluster domain-containing protein [Deltaproteobacteria bacterium]